MDFSLFAPESALLRHLVQCKRAEESNVSGIIFRDWVGETALGRIICHFCEIIFLCEGNYVTLQIET